LTRNEQALLAETSTERLRALGEDALIELHARVRRARNKFVHLHRREVAQHVDATRARGVASVPPRRSASKAEIFEDALARVSASLARAARATAASLRAERLAAARSAVRPAAPKVADRRRERTTAPTPPTPKRAPIGRKRVAATRAASARRQAKHDAR
jgi:hypothetical protein